LKSQFNAYEPPKTFSKEDEGKQKQELNLDSNPEKPTPVTNEENRKVNPKSNSNKGYRPMPPRKFSQKEKTKVCF
jgi:hypothetical protein